MSFAACQPGEADDGLEASSEGSTGTDGSSAEGSSTSQGTVDGSEGSSTESSSSSALDTGSSTTSADPFCGDGIVLGAEDCDGEDLRGETCESLGFSGGALACDADCMFDLGGCIAPPAAPTLMLGFSAIKQFDFSWAAVAGADHYELDESAAPGEPFIQIDGAIVGESISLEMPLHLRHEATYGLRACNAAGCTASADVEVMSSLVDAVGYVKASNTGVADTFGFSVALSADGNTLAVGAEGEDSSSTGIDGDQANDAAPDSGAVYVFVRDGVGQWSQQAYLKASNADAYDSFGEDVALSGDGRTLIVGASDEASNATGIGGDQTNDSASNAGAVYVFVRDGMDQWSQQAYIKASNTDASDGFGEDVALSADGNTLAVGALSEDSNATGIDGDQADDSATTAGAVYVFVRDGMQQWSQQAYVKASNTDAGDHFGEEVALSADGNTLAVGAIFEDGGTIGIDGDQANDSASMAGAAYVFVRDGMQQWSQQAYIKASNTDAEDRFGWTVVLSGDGDTLAVATPYEDGTATGIGGSQGNSPATENSGAAYVFVRDGMQQWSQQAYVKASNTGITDFFGSSAALDADGDVLVIGSQNENSNATGIEGNQGDDPATGNSGAAYVFVRDGMQQWSQQAYVKASNTDADDFFGRSVALSGDASRLAVGGPLEGSDATGIDGDQANESAPASGAVYLY